MCIRKILLPLGAAALLALAACSGNKEKSADSAAADGNTEAVAETPASAVINLAKGEEIDFTAGKPIVIDFNATWCGPCRQFGPIFEEVAAANADKALFYSVDVDVHPELAANYNVTSIPMVAYISPNGDTATKVGFQTKEEFQASVADLIK